MPPAVPPGIKSGLTDQISQRRSNARNAHLARKSTCEMPLSGRDQQGRRVVSLSWTKLLPA